MFKPCFLIPVYNHKGVLGYLLEQLKSYGLPCILVNDGSEPVCREVMEQLSQQHDWVNLYHLESNQGKGAAVICGFRHALAAGYTHAFQIDADGQHNLQRIHEFLASAEQQPQALVLGCAVYDESIPKSRLYGRYVTHFWVWLETLSLQIRDSMCGFRIYPLQSSWQIIDRIDIAKRMEFDIEIVVRLHWSGIQILNLPVEVSYPMDGISHFDVLWDNLRISRVHAMLFFVMMAQLPERLLRGKSSAINMEKNS